MNKKWCQIDISIVSKYQELLSGQLAYIGFSGFLQTETNLSCYILSHKYNPSLQNKLKEIINRFNNEFPNAIKFVKKKTIIERNWNKEWENNVDIVKVTPNLIIAPTWKNIPNKYKNKISIYIDPKMSFGTGHHETTRLCLLLIEKCITPNISVLDFGCGTGILSIACAKYGANKIVAVDNDEWAIKNTKENIRKNRVAGKIEVRLGSISCVKNKQFDFIVANIDFITISKFINNLTKRVKKNGTIIISGILLDDFKALIKLFKRNSLEIIEYQSDNEWIALALRGL